MGSLKVTNALLLAIAALLVLLLMKQPAQLSVFDTLPERAKASLSPEAAARLRATQWVRVAGTVDVQ